MYRAQHATAMMIKTVNMARSFDEPGTRAAAEGVFQDSASQPTPEI
jgi:hypothetical protein